MRQRLSAKQFWLFGHAGAVGDELSHQPGFLQFLQRQWLFGLYRHDGTSLSVVRIDVSAERFRMCECNHRFIELSVVPHVYIGRRLHERPVMSLLFVRPPLCGSGSRLQFFAHHDDDEPEPATIAGAGAELSNVSGVHERLCSMHHAWMSVLRVEHAKHELRYSAICLYGSDYYRQNARTMLVLLLIDNDTNNYDIDDDVATELQLAFARVLLLCKRRWAV